MSIARKYNRVLHRQLQCRAVWPLNKKVEPGDYGVFSGGLFQRMGNIKTDFAVDYEVEPGAWRAKKLKYNYESSWSLDVGASVPIKVVDAKLKLALTGKNSFSVSAEKFVIQRLKSPLNVARQLHAHDGWRSLQYYVVMEAHLGSDFLFYGSESGGGAVEVSGTLAEINNLQNLGTIGASLKFSHSHNMTYALEGGRGSLATVGVNLFRVRAISGVPRLLGGPEDASAESAVPEMLEDFDGDDTDLDA